MGELSAEIERTLHRATEPFSVEFLDVGDGHALYVEQCGRSEGLPILFVHGGPGAGCSAADRRFFDPDRFRAVLVDQRGAGRSKPHGSIEHNTTADLIADFERVRRHLGIDRWHVFGGSWGSTLGLAYAIAHPESCLSLTLRGIWLFRQVELDWWFQGLRAIQPERWRVFSEQVGETEPRALLDAYWDRLTGSDRAAAERAARIWSVYEGACCTLLPNDDFTAAFADPQMAWSLARLEAHFFRNQRFDPDDRLLREVPRIRHLPTFIVHGRYDIVCPVAGAVDLHRALPESDLAIVDDAGHASREPGTARHLVAACDRIATDGDPRRVDARGG